MKLAILLLLAALPVACQPAQSSEDCEKEAQKPVASECTYHIVPNSGRAIFQYSPLEPAPTAETCKSLGGGTFDCPDDYCNVVYYTGNCPICPGGGE